MPRPRFFGLLLALVVLTAQAKDVFVPPVLKGVKGEGKARHDRPVPLPAAGEQWTLVQSKHFVFISSAGEKRTREEAEDLETLAAALSRLNPQFSSETLAPTRVIIFRQRREALPYFQLLLDRDDPNVSGVYVSQSQGGSMLMNLPSGWRGDRTPFHELIHNLIANGGTTPPLWLDEGLAEYFSNAEVRKGAIRAGEAVQQHLDALRRRDLIPVADLFKVVRESDTYNLPAGQRVFYAESWAIVDWLMRQAGSRTDKFYDFLADVSHGVAVEDALARSYGKRFTDLQHALESYNRPAFAQFGITIPVPNVDTSTTTTPLDRAGILYELGHYLSGFEVARKEAERHFRAALVANPRHARAIAALGELRARDAMLDEAVKFFDQATAADPNDADINLAYAEALLQTQIGPLAESNEVRDEDVARFRKARELTERAIALKTTETARATGDLGISYIVEKDSDLAPGIAGLEKAHALAPARLDYTVHLFAMYRRAGDRAKADPLFALLDAARNAQVAYAARAVIMRVEMAHANALLKDQKLDEAASVIRALAAETADRDAKSDLERQAGEIIRVAEQNRQIEMYNKAIAQVTSGDYKAAMKTLTKLLTTATDAGVIRDAKKLQQKLAARLKS